MPSLVPRPPTPSRAMGRVRPNAIAIASICRIRSSPRSRSSRSKSARFRSRKKQSAASTSTRTWRCRCSRRTRAGSSLSIAAIGDDVKKGQTLFTIDSPDLLQAESTLIAAAGVLELTTRNLARLRELYKTLAVSQTRSGTGDLRSADRRRELAGGARRGAHLRQVRCRNRRIVATRAGRPDAGRAESDQRPDHGA